ncbi:hypothetical protein GBAR_LOCUS12497 [Geodia barretti]|uniref:Uncharacterized protein n=1 Tax=Geodia barretti TaxID=519541 RepID=A0AA35WHT9_GEOBA|nr:hypothetical protein GBAR_LOCUS12497 [Geodia barretti]
MRSTVSVDQILQGLAVDTIQPTVSLYTSLIMVALSSLAAIESVYSTVLYATEAMTVETTVTK